MLSDPLLKRYWCKTKAHIGYGVTAYSKDDALSLLSEVAMFIRRKVEIEEIIENIDIRTLDQQHVIPNMGAPNVRGVWFPKIK